MTDEKLDQILQQALTPEINDYEITIKKRVEVSRTMRIKTFIKPVAAVAACVALIVVSSYVGNQSFIQNSDDEIVTEVVKNVKNAFTVTVQAAEPKKLEKGKAVPVVLSDTSKSSAWSGDNRDKSVSYCVGAPLICEGENVDKVTYSISRGAFQIVQPENSNIIVEGEEYDGKLNVGAVGESIVSGKKFIEKYYTSYTVAANQQTTADTDIYICNECVMSSRDYHLMWDTDSTLQEKVQARNAAFGDLKIICTVTYKDGTTDKVDIAVGNDIMTYEKAGVEEANGKKAQMKGVFTTFKMQ